MPGIRIPTRDTLRALMEMLKTMENVELKDVYQARKVTSMYLPKTVLASSSRLSRQLGFETYVKCENTLPTGAFKIRGGIYLMSTFSEAERRKCVITASTGNHGQSIAYAASIFGVRAIIAMADGANQYKVEAIRKLGASVEFHGSDYDEARTWAENEAQRSGYRYIHTTNPFLIAGVGTLFLEIMEDLPDLDAILVPIGGGTCAAAACIVSKTINPDVKIIGVQSEKAPAFQLSWKKGRVVETDSADTFAEGLATRVAYSATLDILIKMIDDIILVSDEEIKRAILTLVETTHQLAEGAGAASTAGAFKIRDRLHGKKVVLVLSGGNLTLEDLRSIM